MVQEAIQNNEDPNPKSGVLTPKTSSKKPWVLDDVVSALSHPPAPSTSSPVPFFHILSRLKTTKREGWRRFGLNHGESVADHMYRMSIITMLAPPSISSKLDIPRCTKMALIHDMAELLVGDITPVDGVPKGEKSRREAETMEYLTKRLLGNVGGGAVGEELLSVWQEYEDGKSFESRFVHDVDKVELILQMVDYERQFKGEVDLSEFVYVATKIDLPEMKEWADEILKERIMLWKELEKTEPSLKPTDQEAHQTNSDAYYDRSK